MKLISAIRNKDLEEFRELIKMIQKVYDKTLIQKYFCDHEIDLFCLISEYSQLEMLEYLMDQMELLPYLSAVDKMKRDNNIKMTLFNCMRNGNITLLEKFYDYFAGDLHCVLNKTINNDYSNNLSDLLDSLRNAFTDYQRHVSGETIDPQVFVDLHCITIFNKFQIELYEKLSSIQEKTNESQTTPDENNITQEIKALKEIIDVTLSLHEKYCNEEIYKDVPFPNLDVTNGESRYQAGLRCYMFKIFFFKCDYNVCLIILDNLYLLKERLKMPGMPYQNLESRLYYYIYHLKSKFSFYLSKTELVDGGPMLFEQNDNVVMYNTFYRMDVGALMRNNIIYLERECFLETLEKFKDELRKPIAEENIRVERSQMSNDELQPLIPYSELRDDYSLKKMFGYLQALSQDINTTLDTQWDQLIIERTSQIVGEFIKISKESKHLEATTQALILAELPIHIANSLINIRLFLSKSDCSQILRRIEILNNRKDILRKTLQDLLKIKEIIKRILRINRYFVNRSIAKHAANILYNRKNSIENNVSDSIPAHVFSYYMRFLGECIHSPHSQILINKFYKEHWHQTGLSENLMKEIGQIQHDLNVFRSKQNKEQERIKSFLDKYYFYYKNVINALLEQMMFQKRNWATLKVEFLKIKTINLLDCPNNEDMCRIKSYLGNNKEEKNNTLLQLIEAYVDVQPIWDLIKRLFEFLIKKSEVFECTVAEIKFNLFSRTFEKLCRDGFDTDNVSETVSRLFQLIEREGRVNDKHSNDIICGNHNSFEGLRELEELFKLKEFITEDEMQYVIKNISEHQSGTQIMIDNFETLNMESKIHVVKSLNTTDGTIKEIIKNISNRSSDILKCYLNRVSCLTRLLNGQRKDFLVIKYKSDRQFRTCLEMLLVDIFNISSKTSTFFLRKSNKFLCEINLRHILTHGSPLLEVIGDFLDPNDLPNELIGKSMELTEDLKSLHAMYELKINGFDFSTINNNIDEFHNNEKGLVENFKKSDRWSEYLLFLHECTKGTKPKSRKEKVAPQESELIKAIIGKEVITEITETVDVNAVDKLGKAAIHYAAIQGNNELIKLLVENGADINITNKKDNNWTALHYATRKGNKATVDYLISCTALVKEDDNGDTYKDIEDKQKIRSKERANKKVP